jgi:peroxiredoxin
LVVIGVHTPETSAERQPNSVRAKVKEAEFDFPVVVDNDKKNWDAWGNSMWPSVYLIDKKGRIRYWWVGELDWNGAGGQTIMATKIEELLAEND